MIRVDHVVLDYGLGNANSIASCLRDIGCHVVISNQASQLYHARGIYIPGVGSFNQAMTKLQEQGLVEVLNNIKKEGDTLIVGMCLGMQLFAQSSDENGCTEGLGWIPGKVKNLDEHIPKEHRLPHIGWNKLEETSRDALFSLATENDSYYFDHSFHFETNRKYVCATTRYGAVFTAMVKRDNVVGFQFHPEKSQLAGKRLLIGLLNSYQIDRQSVWITNESQLPR